MPRPSRHPRSLLRLVALAGGGAALLFLLAVRTFHRAPPAATHIQFTDTCLSLSKADPATGFAPAPAPPGLASVMRLASAQNFSAAAAGIPGLPPDERATALASVFALWAECTPREAAAAALAFPDHDSRDAAWLAVVSVWARQSPAALADYALPLLPAAAGHRALEEAVRHWLDRDPDAARAWVERLPSTPEADAIVALVAQQPALVRAEPDLALSWAETIHEPALRSRVLGRVVREWRDSAPAEAAHYARASPDLFPSEREDILVGERFTAHP